MTTFETLEYSPVIRFLLAVTFAVLGYVLLTKGNLLIGGFAWWCCGVNCGRLIPKTTRGV